MMLSFINYFHFCLSLHSKIVLEKILVSLKFLFHIAPTSHIIYIHTLFRLFKHLFISYFGLWMEVSLFECNIKPCTHVNQLPTSVASKEYTYIFIFLGMCGCVLKMWYNNTKLAGLGQYIYVSNIPKTIIMLQQWYNETRVIFH